MKCTKVVNSWRQKRIYDSVRCIANLHRHRHRYRPQAENVREYGTKLTGEHFFPLLHNVKCKSQEMKYIYDNIFHVIAISSHSLRLFIRFGYVIRLCIVSLAKAHSHRLFSITWTNIFISFSKFFLKSTDTTTKHINHLNI